MTQNPNITLTLPLDQVNLVLEALAELPAKRTFDILVMIRGTAQAQIQQQQEAALAGAGPLPEIVKGEGA